MAGTQTHPLCGQSQFCPTGHRLCLLMHHLPTWNWAPPSNTIRVWVRTPVPFGTSWEADWSVRAVSPHHASLHLTWRAGFNGCFPLWLFSRKCWCPISELMIPLLFFPGEPESLQPVLIPELPLAATSNQSRTQKDAYSWTMTIITMTLQFAASWFILSPTNDLLWVINKSIWTSVAEHLLLTVAAR